MDYRFVKVAPGKYIGFETYGYGNHQYRITDPEKLIVYAKSIHNIAATKRMGFLAELMTNKKHQGFISYAKKNINPKYNLFDPYGPDKGKFDSKWKLRLNISREDIINICQS